MSKLYHYKFVFKYVLKNYRRMFPLTSVYVDFYALHLNVSFTYDRSILLLARGHNLSNNPAYGSRNHGHQIQLKKKNASIRF